MIDSEGTLILTSKTKITNDIIDKIKKIIIDESFRGKSLKKIQNLINLEEVDFSNCTFYEIGFYAFENCKKLKSIELPETIKILEMSCFSHYEKLESVILHGVESINEWVFYGCISLKYLFISDSIKKIDETAFFGIPMKQEITIICPDGFYDYFKELFPNAIINGNEYVLK